MVFSRNLSEDEIRYLGKLQDFVKNAHSDSDSHDYSHVLTVLRHAIELAVQVKDKVDPFVVCASALLHDIGKTGHQFSKVHGLLGSSLAREFLDGINVEPKIRDEICRAVVRHTPTSKIPPQTVVEKIVYDADCLDRIGVMGLLRGFIGKTGAMDQILLRYLGSRRSDFEKLYLEESKLIRQEENEKMKQLITLIEDRLRYRMDSIENIFLTEVEEVRKET